MPARAITISFLALVAGVPLAQGAWELARGERLQVLDVFESQLEEQRLRAFDRALREASFVHRYATPWYQWLLLRTLRRGNEKAIVGERGWLYYSEDLDWIAAPSFLDSSWSPVDCIADVHDQLATLGVELVLLPVPAKVTVDPGELSAWIDAGVEPSHPEVRRFFDLLAARHVRALDLCSVLSGDDTKEEHLYLARDTHWTPRTLSRVSDRVAEEIASILGTTVRDSGSFPVSLETVTGPGDLVEMLRLPSTLEEYPLLRVEIERPTALPVIDDPRAAVLLLGDSFTRVFSDPALGLGQGAGLAEQLAARLGTSIDSIALAGGGALAVREALARRAGLSADEGGLAGKRVVVWQFAMRDLAGRDELWERVELGGAGAAVESGRLVLQVELAKRQPLPEEFDYAFGLSVFGYRVLRVVEGHFAEPLIWVAHPVVADYHATADASLATGERFTLTLEPVEDHHDLESTSWFRHPEMDVRAPIWFPIERAPLR